MLSLDTNKELLEQANVHLSQLSDDKLKFAIDFLEYLQKKEEYEATEELLNISGFEQELLEADQEIERGEIVSLESIYRS
jgi:hypothetical protein